MPRETIPLQIDDLSRFARTLASELDDPPSHLTLMNLLARAGGYRNYQHLRADSVTQDRLGTPKTDTDPIDHRRVEKALGHFDDLGRLERWPSRNAMQKLVVWVFWADLEAGASMSEADVNERFDEQHRFRDPATIRRMLVGLGRVERERDGSSYTRVEMPVPVEAAELIRHVRGRRPERRMSRETDLSQMLRRR